MKLKKADGNVSLSYYLSSSITVYPFILKRFFISFRKSPKTVTLCHCGIQFSSMFSASHVAASLLLQPFSPLALPQETDEWIDAQP